MYKNNYILEAAIKDVAKVTTLAGMFDMKTIALVVDGSLEAQGLENTLSAHRTMVLILEGMAEAMVN